MPNRGRTCARCGVAIALLSIETESGSGTAWIDGSGSERCLPMGLFHYYDRRTS